MRDTIFVSYSHSNQYWLAQIQPLLRSAAEGLRVDAWDDTRIAPGSRWQGEIREALDTAAAAILLLSPAFFASAFIRDHELPALVEAARAGDLVILPLVVEPLEGCDHSAITSNYQAVNDPSRALSALDEANRQPIWLRLGASINQVAAKISDETHIAAEMTRLANDLAAHPEVGHVLDKMERARADPAFDETPKMRENTLVFLEGQRCQAAATKLMEEFKRAHLTPVRSKALVRMLEQVGKEQELALRRATELTQDFANEMMAMVKEAKTEEK
jgi:hypothetical protein